MIFHYNPTILGCLPLYFCFFHYELPLAIGVHDLWNHQEKEVVAHPDAGDVWKRSWRRSVVDDDSDDWVGFFAHLVKWFKCV